MTFIIYVYNSGMFMDFLAQLIVMKHTLQPLQEKVTDLRCMYCKRKEEEKFPLPSFSC